MRHSNRPDPAAVAAALKPYGVPTDLCDQVELLMSGGGWRSRYAVPPTIEQALAHLNLLGFPDMAGDPVNFAIDTGDVAAAASADIVLGPPIPVLIVGCAFDDATIAADFTTTAQTYAQDQIYPNGGKDASSIARVKDAGSFTYEALRSNANPWPEPLLVCDDLMISWTVRNDHATATQALKGTFYGIMLDDGHKAYASLLSHYKKRAARS